MSAPLLIIAGAVAASFIAMSWVIAAEPGMFNGRPEFKEGRDRGYFVWREGDTWHIRWTAMGAMRRFSGNIIAEGGELKSLKRIDVETERKVIRPGRAPHVTVAPRGRVHVRGGRPPVVATREQDKIEKGGDRRIVFLAHTNDDIDGFDFKVDDRVRELRFMLEIDGASRAADVDAGRNNHHPANNPFVVNLR